MLNKKLLNDDAAFWHMEMMAWLISEFGPPLVPRIPVLLHRTVPLHDRKWEESDQRSVFTWAEDEVGTLKADLQMHDINTNLLANSTDNQAMGHEPPQATLYATPIEFDPMRCTEPGFFSTSTLLKLAEIKANSRPRPDSVRPNDYSALTLLTIAFLGQGLAPLLEEVANSGKMTRGEYGALINTLAYTSALALACRRMQPETVFLNYGPAMSKPFAKKISAAYRQIHGFKEEIKILKIMTSKERNGEVYEFTGQSLIA